MKSLLRWSMCRSAHGHRFVTTALFFLYCFVPLISQAQISSHITYDEKIRRSRTFAALDENLFGDKINLQDGTVAFTQDDVVLDTNSQLKVFLGRKTPSTNQGRDKTFAVFGKDWEPNVPYMMGTYDTRVGWDARLASNGASSGGSRCSPGTIAPSERLGPWPYYHTQLIYAHMWWHGININIPGYGEEKLLKVNSGQVLPADGKTYYGTTKSSWRVSCLPSIKNGAGEGFAAVLPDGTVYYFDWMAIRNAIDLTDNGVTDTNGDSQDNFHRLAPLTDVYLYATKVVDRFGNYVTYTYDPNHPSRITTIESNDGVRIDIQYNPEGQVSEVKSGSRTWTYSYVFDARYQFNRLSSLTLPDASSWQFQFQPMTGSSGPTENQFWGSGCSMDPKEMTSAVAPDPSRVATLTMTHPSGARGEFKYRRLFHGTNNTPGGCDYFGSVDTSYWWGTYGVPSAYVAESLFQKKIAGPGIADRMWSYMYYPTWSFDPAWESSAGQCSGSCATTSQTVVNTNDGVTRRFTFGNSYSLNLGKLLSETIEKNSSVLQLKNYSYLVSAVGQPFPDNAGEIPKGSGLSLPGLPGSIDRYVLYGNPFTFQHRPRRGVVTQLDGVTFNSNVSSTCNGNNTSCFDSFARPLGIIKSSSLGYSKTDATEYHDDLSVWVLGQVKRTTTSGIETSRTDYGWKALPWKTYSFGKLQQTLSYDSTSTVAGGQLGTLKTVADGNNNVTTLTNWYRGIPRSIQYADTTTESAVVDGNGWITATTDENGFSTSYGYDLMGRLDRIVYPAGDTTGWNDTTFTWEYRNFAEHGLPAGHWLRSQITGNGYKSVFLDALWRPVLVHEYDATNISGTLRAISTEYDSSGRAVFQSYPSSSTIPAASGTWTSYDALDRVTSVKQDSELGQLTSTTEYLAGFQTRVTNPRGLQVTTEYEVYDQPTTDFPAGITTSADTATEIHRDVFGKPTLLVRRNHASTQRVERRYIYDGYQQLCKTIEPETGATVMDYDGAGNLQWRSAGTTLTSASSCDTIAGRDSGRKVTRYYDARNRLSQLLFPDGRGDQVWSYKPDGLPASITTYNDPGNGAPVVNVYDYNKRRMLTGESVAQTDWYGWDIGYGYDANGSLSTQTYPTGLVVNYAPNALGQPTQASSYASGVQYYPNGAIKQFTYGNGIVHTMSQNDRQLPSRSADAGVIDFTFAYDANGNTTAIRDMNAVQYAYSGNRDLVYDGLDRLTQAHLHWWQVDDWTYDALDNIRSKVHFNGSTTITQDYTYDGANQLVNVQESGATTVGLLYDEQGNLKNKNGVVYQFDFGNRLRGTIGQEWYRYDGHGRRVLNWRWNESGVLSQYSQAGQLIYDENYRPSGRKATEYVYLAGSVVAARERNIDTNVYMTKYQHTDALGSPVAVTNTAGAVIERTNYEPYGAAINKTVDGIGYTGHVMDSATGLTYMQQRYYDPMIGRFLSVDPVTANSDTGANFNRYWYANNNPYRFTDPDGRFGVQIVGGVIGAVISGGASYLKGNDLRTVAKDAAIGGIVGVVSTIPGGGALAVGIRAGLASGAGDAVSQAYDKGIRNVDLKQSLGEGIVAGVTAGILKGKVDELIPNRGIPGLPGHHPLVREGRALAQNGSEFATRPVRDATELAAGSIVSASVATANVIHSQRSSEPPPQLSEKKK